MQKDQDPAPDNRDSEPAAQERGRTSFDSSQEKPEPREPSPLAQVEATMTLVSAWLNNLQTLFRLELDRTIEAGRRMLAIQLVLLPLGIAFLLSLCAGVGLLAYYFSQSVYIGFTAFVLAQLVLLTAMMLYMKKLRALLGFSETRKQAREAMDNVLETLK
ncbi:hypothetical protein [Microbulbifer sp. YPW16]|uniref:hypothetical protein n=1 Tax=Microbulbifer sp. YPW16 TaxID=2904242 RepID=UPI001E2CBF56|nr:hypothetical protein [Microbulbifer sp. YPW16]UHQ54647.1 hypothetical protein LVE68_14220 [Microbulbifer sp. YPW16]